MSNAPKNDGSAIKQLLDAERQGRWIDPDKLPKDMHDVVGKGYLFELSGPYAQDYRLSLGGRHAYVQRPLIAAFRMEGRTYALVLEGTFNLLEVYPFDPDAVMPRGGESP